MGCGTRHQFAIGQNNKEEVEEEKTSSNEDRKAWGIRMERSHLEVDMTNCGWLACLTCLETILRSFSCGFEASMRGFELASRYHARVISMGEDYYSSIELLPLPFLCIYPVWYCWNDFVKIITISSSTLDHDAHIVTESRCMKAWWEL